MLSWLAFPLIITALCVYVMSERPKKKRKQNPLLIKTCLRRYVDELPCTLPTYFSKGATQLIQQLLLLCIVYMCVVGCGLCMFVLFILCDPCIVCVFVFVGFVITLFAVCVTCFRICDWFVRKLVSELAQNTLTSVSPMELQQCFNTDAQPSSSNLKIQVILVLSFCVFQFHSYHNNISVCSA